MRDTLCKNYVMHPIESHRRQVTQHKQRGSSLQEIAAYNLSTAYYLIGAVFQQLKLRQVVGLASLLKDGFTFLRTLLETDQESFRKSIAEVINNNTLSLPDSLPEKTPDAFLSHCNSMDDYLNHTLNRVMESEVKVSEKLKPEISTLGQLFTDLTNLTIEDLLYPMHISYIHCFHRITLMGITSSRYLVTFRKVSVNIGDPNIYFPAPSFVPGLMDEFCKHFPWVSPLDLDFNHPNELLAVALKENQKESKNEDETSLLGRKILQTINVILSRAQQYDDILKAAEISYKFVHIHPYRDGNGRVSRILMNLLLHSQSHPPVHLKSNPKNRKRYIWALRRANRGNLKPLACLIALALKENYDIFISTLDN